MRVVLLSLVAACSFSREALPPVDDPLIDASLTDVPVIMIDACSTYSTQLNTCTIPVGGDMPLALTGSNTYNTGTHELKRGATTIPVAHATVMTTTGYIDVIYVSTFTLAQGATLVASGPLPLAIAASGTVQIDGAIDLVGPAAGSRTDAICGTQVGKPGSDSTGGAGGGGGGAFQGAGGDGSRGNNGATVEGQGGDKITLPTGLFGGCDGGAGGDAGQQDGPEAGDGAGAILIAAGTAITIGVDGVINAGGGHGRGGGCANCGGSGGGSGGMIFLESASVTVAGVLVANGGSGGEGSNGRDGADGQPSAMAAMAGTGGDSNGGNGGDGSSALELDGEDTNDERPEGGGGGGGGAGFITIRATTTAITGTISPPFVPWP